jgi:hypothetical protein
VVLCRREGGKLVLLGRHRHSPPLGPKIKPTILGPSASARAKALRDGDKDLGLPAFEGISGAAEGEKAIVGGNGADVVGEELMRSIFEDCNKGEVYSLDFAIGKSEFGE